MASKKIQLLLIMIILLGIAGCDNSCVGWLLGAVIAITLAWVLFGWIPVIGQIIAVAITIMCLNLVCTGGERLPGETKGQCGCSAFCNKYPNTTVED